MTAASEFRPHHFPLSSDGVFLMAEQVADCLTSQNLHGHRGN